MDAADKVIADVDEITAEDTEDLAASARTARQQYEKVRGLYEDFARSVASVLESCFVGQGIVTHSITMRAKDPESFERKAARPSPDDPAIAKYDNPMEQITDKAGVRITTYFLNIVEKVSEIVESQFQVIEKIEKINSEPDRLGYQSVHYLIGFSADRVALPEYERFAGLVAEVQVRTILQHAWAEIEHDIQYKSISALPVKVQRRFASLAGLIEIADREFQAIDDENQHIIKEARQNVNLGQLEKVEITPDSLRAYLDKKYFPDGRMRDWSYGYTARILRELGFANLAEVDECIDRYNDGAVSRAIYGNRQGQITRFEDVLLASMGDNYYRAHRYTARDPQDLWFPRACLRKLEKIRTAGISIGDYKPSQYPDNVLSDGVVKILKAEEVSAPKPPVSVPVPPGSDLEQMLMGGNQLEDETE